ncbi:BMP family ABC transporter substrate-binding protein (plasmid) [Kitasatospora sp. NBC_00070]|uniref:BMP family lipoprotein n=1 Tax=Kitasatospora sp. NBC_00070 TaxID=2975962 RepID=UPI002F91B454
MVSDTGGLQDHSFNFEAYAGLKQAASVNKTIEVQQVTSVTRDDYFKHIEAYASGGCDLIVAVGVAMTNAAIESAKLHPSQKYILFDGNSTPPGIKGIQFNTAQSAFLAGYLAAGMTKTGKVATFGGANFESVRIKMDGFWEGVTYYNKEHQKDVKILGWDVPSQNGTFAPGQSFTDIEGGRQITKRFQDEGADIVLPVAGGTGKGALEQALDSGGKLSVIWTDTDGYFSNPDYRSVFLTSIVRDISSTVSTVVDKAAKGDFNAAKFIGDLANKSTDLAPFHDYEDKVPSSLVAELSVVRQGIISGGITISSPNQPKAGP